MSVNIYQVFTRLFRNDAGQNIYNGDLSTNGSSMFNHFTEKALHEIRNMGFSHVWFTGIIRHASCTSFDEPGLEADHPAVVKGKAGSPYAVKDFFDVVPDLAEDVGHRMKEFYDLVNRCHKQDLKVIIDFVPNHVCRQYQSIQKPEKIPALGANDDTSMSFSAANNFYYIPGEPFQIPEGINTEGLPPYYEMPAKATGNNVFEAQPQKTDWYETVKLNYGVDFRHDSATYFDPIPQTWYRMYEVLHFWAHKGVDGFRIDMAEMVPVEFWGWVVPRIREDFPEMLFIAEIYKPDEYRKYIEQGHFDWLYDKEQFYNIVRAVIEEKVSASAISDIWKAQEGIDAHMLRFLENHDEQRIASEFFAANPEKAIPGMLLAATMHKGPLMVYFGQELAEQGMDEEGFSGKDGKTTIFDYWRVEKYQKWVNGGRFDNEMLDQKTKDLRAAYVELLRFRQKYEVIHSGGFYDLMWVNQHLDTDYVYCFIRHSDNQAILVLLNFDTADDKQLTLNLPVHALKHIGLHETKTVNAGAVLGKHNSVVFKQKDNQSLEGQFKISPSSGCIFELTQ
ncbi:MAG TPA: alpha-amylase family glycosyl hydrolase [Salinivirga sp.]|uniref:alpha-amylase family glycosyl hydrolase n=1 Tax=Salinivirga sp. TaxID=1970192 RepID=UPI002B492BB7|nr:alpha-amylase family glycosyl hydrolase [Salinivirga sp.]HKK60571.1 alpha-amylase family glycosyl hydrolase [Salinivirga sp.]